MYKEQIDGKKALMPLRYMSSGERQFMHTTSATIYHLLNLKSVKNDHRPAYRFFNVIMDEVEICYHPEMQRTFVCRLIDLFKQLILQSQSSINIIMTTHSPFILSDIPKCNIIYLEEGKIREFDIKLENSQLSVIDKVYINGGLLFKKTICCYSRQRVGYKVIERTMSGVFYLCNVLQLVIDRFNQGPFSEQDLVGNAHQRGKIGVCCYSK